MKIYILLILSIIFCEFLKARDGKSEITIGYGLFSTSNAIVQSADIYSTGLSASMTSAYRKYSGSFHLGYRYYDYKTQCLPVAIGGTFLYEQAQSNAFIGNTETGRFADQFYTLVGKISLIYFDKGKLMLYGTMATGATYCARRFTANDGTSDVAGAVHLNFQLSPVGIKYGNRAGIFVEAGLGSKGMLCAGIFARF